MSRIVIVILIYHRHKPIDFIVILPHGKKKSLYFENREEHVNTVSKCGVFL
jgi:hypothetical protein